MKKLAFNCPACGSKLLEEVIKNATVVSVVDKIYDTPDGVDLEYQTTPAVEIAEGEVAFYQCGACGEHLLLNGELVTHREDLQEWLKFHACLLLFEVKIIESEREYSDEVWIYVQQSDVEQPDKRAVLAKKILIENYGATEDDITGEYEYLTSDQFDRCVKIDGWKFFETRTDLADFLVNRTHV